MKTILLLLMVSVAAKAETKPGLRTECSNSRPFQGEVFTCSFVLYATDNRLEVEVAKFPEFRGFWSENIALRQGPVMLMPEPRLPGLSRLVIGSYLLTPMWGKESPTIEPMRLVVRSLGMGSSEQVFVSEPPALTFRPLPPVPPADKPFFSGAVGAFVLRAEAPGAGFFPNEPILLRYFLTGSGNFAEVNALSLQLPDSVKLLSQRASLQGSGPFQTKIFEIALSVASVEGGEIPPVRLTFFNPQIGRFETTLTSPVRLQLLTRPTAPLVEEAIDFGPLEKEPNESVALWRQPLFRLLNVGLLVLWAFFFIHLWAKRVRERRARDPWRKIQARWRELFQPANLSETWCADAEQLLFDTLATRSAKPLRTRREAVAFSLKTYGEQTTQAVKEVFSEWEKSRFSHLPSETPTAARWEARLKHLRKQLSARHRHPKTS